MSQYLVFAVLFIIYYYERFVRQVGEIGPCQGHQYQHQRNRKNQTQKHQAFTPCQTRIAEDWRLLQKYSGSQGRIQEIADPSHNFPSLRREGDICEPYEA